MKSYSCVALLILINNSYFLNLFGPAKGLVPCLLTRACKNNTSSTSSQTALLESSRTQLPQTAVHNKNHLTSESGL